MAFRRSGVRTPSAPPSCQSVTSAFSLLPNAIQEKQQICSIIIRYCAGGGKWCDPATIAELICKADWILSPRGDKSLLPGWRAHVGGPRSAHSRFDRDN